jgi:hypothetical protein
MSNAAEDRPFPTVIFQTVFTSVLIAILISYSTGIILLEKEMSIRRLFDNLYLLAPTILGVFILHKIHGKNATPLRVRRIRIGRWRISSYQIIHLTSLTLIYAVFEMMDEILPQILEFDNFKAFLIFSTEEALLYPISISVLSVLTICLSFSLRVRISIVEVLILGLFTTFSFSSLIYQTLGIRMLQWKIGGLGSIFVYYLIIICYLSKVWNIEILLRGSNKPLFENTLSLFYALAFSSFLVGIVGILLKSSSLDPRVFFPITLVFLILIAAIRSKGLDK